MQMNSLNSHMSGYGLVISSEVLKDCLVLAAACAARHELRAGASAHHGRPFCSFSMATS
jgi:hypothetical protein